MSITKVTFSKDNATQSDEMFAFLNQYASQYFDVIRRQERLPINLECVINLPNDKVAKLQFDYHTHSTFCNIIVWTDARESAGEGGYTTLSWDSYGQVPISAGYVTSKGFALQIGTGRQYSNFLWLFVSTTESGDTFVFLPNMSYPNITPKWLNMHKPTAFNSTIGFDNASGAVKAYWGLGAGGICLCPLVTQAYCEYSPYLWQIVYTPWPTTTTAVEDRIGKVTVNGIEFFTNGYICLQDSPGTYPPDPTINNAILEAI